MSAVIPNTPYSFLSNPMAGIRLLLRETGGGLKFLGGAREPKFSLTNEFAQLYDAGSGAEALVRQVPNLTGIKVEFKATEFLRDNLARFFMATAPTRVAAAPTQTHAAELFTGGKIGERYGLAGGRQTTEQRTALAVYNVTDAALLVLDTDYTVVVQYGLTFIEMKVDTYDAHSIRVGTGATAVADYNYQVLAHDLSGPMTRLTRSVSGILQIASKSGINAELEFDLAELNPGGDFNLQTKQFSDMNFALELKDNSATDATYPFGKLKVYGYESAGGALI